jgi:hypothetical protein
VASGGGDDLGAFGVPGPLPRTGPRLLDESGPESSSVDSVKPGQTVVNRKGITRNYLNISRVNVYHVNERLENPSIKVITISKNIINYISDDECSYNY